MATSSLSTFSPLRLLLATGNPSLDRRVLEILMMQRRTVEAPKDAAEALRILLEDHAPEIAILGTVGGFELAAEVKRRRSRRQSWIMLLADAVDPATVAAAADAGVDDLILCPVNEMDLQIRLGVAERAQEIRRQLEAQAHAASFHASHDHLTGLWSREALLGQLFPETDRVQRMGTPLSFLLMDLDDFATVNVEHGYETGDKILQEIAMRLRRYLRSYDLIGRCGEDEFLIALPGCTAAQGMQLAGRLRALLQRPFNAGFGPVALTASIGVAQSRGRSPLVVLREAERALAVAKLEGRDCEREFSRSPQKVARPVEELVH